MLPQNKGWLEIQAYKIKVPEKGASSIAFILKRGKLYIQNLERLWNLADISMLRDSSGRDFLLCNSKLKTKVGIQFNVTAKKCFVSTTFTRHWTVGTWNLASLFTCRTRPCCRWEGAAFSIHEKDQLTCVEGKVHRFYRLISEWNLKWGFLNFYRNHSCLFHISGITIWTTPMRTAVEK